MSGLITIDGIIVFLCCIAFSPVLQCLQIIRTHNCAFLVSITPESTDSSFCPKKPDHKHKRTHTYLECEDFCLLYRLSALCWNEVSIVTLPTFQSFPLSGCYLTLVSEYIRKDFVIYLEFTVFSKSDKMFPFYKTFSLFLSFVFVWLMSRFLINLGDILRLPDLHIPWHLSNFLSYFY